MSLIRPEAPALRAGREVSGWRVAGCVTGEWQRVREKELATGASPPDTPTRQHALDLPKLQTHAVELHLGVDTPEQSQHGLPIHVAAADVATADVADPSANVTSQVESTAFQRWYEAL